MVWPIQQGDERHVTTPRRWPRLLARWKISVRPHPSAGAIWLTALWRTRDGDGNREADKGVCLLDAEPHSRGAKDNRQGGEAVGAGVVAIRDEGGAADALADADAVLGDCFVSDEAEEARESHEAQVVNRMRIEQALPIDIPPRRLMPRSLYDEDAGEVFGAP
jgi:hypothetical protein